MHHRESTPSPRTFCKYYKSFSPPYEKQNLQFYSMSIKMFPRNINLCLSMSYEALLLETTIVVITSDITLNHFLNMIWFDYIFCLLLLVSLFLRMWGTYYFGCRRHSAGYPVTLSDWNPLLMVGQGNLVLIHCKLYILTKKNCNVNHLPTTSLCSFPWNMNQINEKWNICKKNESEQTQTNILTLLSKTCGQTDGQIITCFKITMLHARIFNQ